MLDASDIDDTVILITQGACRAPLIGTQSTSCLVKLRHSDYVAYVELESCLTAKIHPRSKWAPHALLTRR